MVILYERWPIGSPSSLQSQSKVPSSTSMKGEYSTGQTESEPRPKVPDRLQEVEDREIELMTPFVERERERERCLLVYAVRERSHPGWETWGVLPKHRQSTRVYGTSNKGGCTPYPVYCISWPQD
jgi:hypothetical protein